MADIFISYSRKASDSASVLANQLKGKGYDVWWDTDLTAGQRFNDTIRERLLDADAVVVIWSPESVASDYVRMEAGIAFAFQKLITLRTPSLPVTELPPAFADYQTGLVSDIDGLVRALAENGVQPRSRARSPKLTREEMLRRLAEVNPALPARLEDWFRTCQGAGFRITFGRSAMIKATVPRLGDVNFGTIFPDGKLQTNYISETSQRAGDPSIAAAYLDGLAKLIDGATVRRDGAPWNWRVDVYGELPQIAELLDNDFAWLQLMVDARQRFLQRPYAA
ncbi:MAG: toll/interleukin-1 receptor domain-containing protein [Hyphomicrobiaceae bacterium]